MSELMPGKRKGNDDGNRDSKAAKVISRASPCLFNSSESEDSENISSNESLIEDEIRTDTQSQNSQSQNETIIPETPESSQTDSQPYELEKQISETSISASISNTPSQTMVKYEDAITTPSRTQLVTNPEVQVMFNTDSLPDPVIRPYPRKFSDRWDSNHVRLPCSNHNKLKNPRTGEEMFRWPIIESAMEQQILCPEDLESTMKQYNSKVGKMPLLHHFFTTEATLEERERFFDETLPEMQKMMINFPKVITAPPKLLLKGENFTVYMTQAQCAHLLVAAFFCAFPRRNSKSRRQTEYEHFNEINFDRLYSNKQNVEKLRTLLNYFDRVTREMPNGVVSFQRCVQTESYPEFKSSRDIPLDVEIRAEGFIENEGECFVQVDFANEYIGGGVLGRGCVQEEIRFIICPELIVSMLITEKMGLHECVIITGAEMYSKYTGYASSYKFNGNKIDQISRDNLKRKMTQLVAMDAIPYYTDNGAQYTAKNMQRDIRKAYISFASTCPKATIATGNWGCGAFGGDPQLKFLIQLMAAAVAKKPLMYFTVDDLMAWETDNITPLSYELRDLLQLVSHLDVASIFRSLLNYESDYGSILKYLQAVPEDDRI